MTKEDEGAPLFPSSLEGHWWGIRHFKTTPPGGAGTPPGGREIDPRWGSILVIA
jgi:hypothetical protein